MDTTLRESVVHYQSALENYLANGQETALHLASELGHQAVASGLDSLAMAKIHQCAVSELLARPLTAEEREQVVQGSLGFFAASLMPLGLKQERCQEANVELRHFNEALEHQIAAQKKKIDRLEAICQALEEQISEITQILPSEHLEIPHELATLSNISQVITSTLDLTEMLTIITKLTTQMLKVAATSIVLYDETKNDLWFAAASGDASEYVRDKRLALGQGIAGWVIQQGQPVLAPDVSQDSRFIKDFDQRSGLATHSMLCVPLQTKGRTIGAISAINKESGSFDQKDLRLLSSLAAPAATAIENGRLYKRAQQEISERRRAENALKESVDKLKLAYEQATIYAQELTEEIRERKRAEEALARERTSLAQRVEERTAELSAANAELARANRLKDEFLANMSHELRTPLNAILGKSEALQEQVHGPLNERQLRSLQSIKESGHHLLSLINDILDLSKIEAGKLELDIRPVSIEAICQASLRLIKESAFKKQLSVDYAAKFDDTTVRFRADERRLKQILVNLLSNAVKFTPDGGSIGLEVTGDYQNQVVRFTVWDTGIGISPKDMERLFHPFVQLDSSLTRQYDGTGLGLSLVYRMVDLHHGGVSIESQVGIGSRLRVSLPWAHATETRQQGAIKEENSPEQAGASSDPFLPRSTAQLPLILLAEDNEQSIDTLQDYLPSKGYRVIVARNGPEVLTRAREERPDLVIIDIQMPGLNGLDAAHRLRAETTLSTIPIIAVTALTMPGDRERCLETGVAEYLSKPVSSKQLATVIEAHLQPANNRD